MTEAFHTDLHTVIKNKSRCSCKMVGVTFSIIVTNRSLHDHFRLHDLNIFIEIIGLETKNQLDDKIFSLRDTESWCLTCHAVVTRTRSTTARESFTITYARHLRRCSRVVACTQQRIFRGFCLFRQINIVRSRPKTNKGSVLVSVKLSEDGYTPKEYLETLNIKQILIVH